MRLSNIFIVAWNEYRQVVWTKSFLLGLLLPVILYGGFFVLLILVGDTSDRKDRTFAVVDETGILFEPLATAARERNLSLQGQGSDKQSGSRFLAEQYAGDLSGSELLLHLSNRVREGELFAFLIIGRDYLPVGGGERNHISYYSDAPSYSDLPDWISSEVKALVEEHRLESIGMSRREIRALLTHNSISRFNLAQMDEQGNWVGPREEVDWLVKVLPFGLVMLMFVAIQMSTPVMLNSVIEEKFQRIAEVLLAAVTPFQLLFGKLLAGIGISLTFAVFYLVSLAVTLYSFDFAGWVPFQLYFWFLLFLLLALLTFGSMFAGISAASGDLKDAQNYAGIVMIFLVVPMMLGFIAGESPDSPFAVIISMVPPASALTMIGRLAVPPGPPLWQVWTAVFINLAFAIVVTWAASRIFRIGILSQGKTPSFKEWMRWIFRLN